MIKFITIVLVGVVLLLAGQFLWKEGARALVTGVEHRVVLTNDGFVPQELAIAKGDTVVFVSEAEREFWPASNQHPAHTVYPEFDPNQPIPANQTWSFVFHKVGTWGYHDHLHSFHTGSINVR